MNTEENMKASGMKKPEAFEQTEEQKRKLEEIKHRMEQLVEAAKKELPEDAFQQEYEAKFLEEQGVMTINEARSLKGLPTLVTYRGLSMQELDERIDFYRMHRG